KMAPLDTELHTGDIVEILTSKQSFGPSRDWLKIAKSTQTKNKIKQFFKKQLREDNVQKGRELIEKEIKAQEFPVKEVLTNDNIKRVCEKFNFAGEDDMYAAVGFNGITAQQVVNRLAEKMRKKREQEEAIEKITVEMKSNVPRKQTESGVIVRGIDNMMIRLSKCCNPVPGDNIIGFITKGRGVSVHRTDCPNIHSEENDRLIPVEWENEGIPDNKSYQVDIEVQAYDRTGLINEVMHVVSEAKTTITAVSGRADKDKIATINLSIMIAHISHLNRVTEKIKSIPDVYSVQRVTN
ncbi:MAG: ACT domain-containing protein, partial [Planococcus donghaensis]